MTSIQTSIALIMVGITGIVMGNTHLAWYFEILIWIVIYTLAHILIAIGEHRT